MKAYKYAAAGVIILLLAGCGSMGDVFGGQSSASRYEIRGTVDSVDQNSRSIYLTNVSGQQSMLSSGGSGNRVRVYYDDRTTVEYQGRNYRPQDLERGDQVAARVSESNNGLVTDSMTVLHNVSAGGTGAPGTHVSSVRGTVTFIDANRRMIEIDRGAGLRATVEYETNTPVYYNNQTYRPMDLERGDEIDIRIRDIGAGRLLAQDITVIRSMSAAGGYGGATSASTIRGTVVFVDTSRRTIELESTSWISGFNPGVGTSTRTVIQYDANAGVEVSGRLQPVTGLERGDVIDVQVQSQQGGALFAQRIILVRDVRR
jgi:hypothetical protein